MKVSAVLPEFRRQGLYSLLLEKMIKLAVNAGFQVFSYTNSEKGHELPQWLDQTRQRNQPAI